MGWVKKHLLELEEQGDWPSPELADKYVCTCHFEDQHLNGFIQKEGHKGKCSYCGEKGMVCDMEKLGKHIMWNISLYFSPLDNAGLYLADGFYDDEQEVIPGYKKIGDYIAPNELAYYDSVDELMYDLDLITEDEDLNDDIKSCFKTEQWISSDFDEEVIKDDSKLLQKVEILTGDFEETFPYAKDKTLVYFDPPYRPLSNTSSFNDYAKEPFNDDAQIRLKEYCDRINQAGFHFMLSNSDCRGKNNDDCFFDDLYSEYRIERVWASRSVNSIPSKRGKLTEILVHNYYVDNVYTA